MKKQYIVKYNRRSGQYGVYDNATREVRWGMDKARAASDAARRNAVNDIAAGLNATIAAISTVLTSTLAASSRGELKALREELRIMRDDAPTVEALELALNREFSASTEADARLVRRDHPAARQGLDFWRASENEW